MQSSTTNQNTGNNFIVKAKSVNPGNIFLTPFLTYYEWSVRHW